MTDVGDDVAVALASLLAGTGRRHLPDFSVLQRRPVAPDASARAEDEAHGRCRGLPP